ncbi:MAG: YdeI/OmpD-associated family protein [Siphonobacter sp.]
MTNPKIDIYLDKAAPFAQPILGHLRKLIHEVCPDVVEVIKWGCPFFEYKGANLCNMAAFKQHCIFGFWLAAKMDDPDGILKLMGEQNGMGRFDKMRSMEDVPSDEIITKYIRQAMQLIDQGEKVSPKAPVERKKLVIPSDFQEVINQNEATQKTFESFSYSCKKEYVQWIEEARTETTRAKRMAQAVEWMAEGKERNWKYKVRGVV